MANGDNLASRTAAKGGQKLVDLGDGRIVDFTGMDDTKIESLVRNEKPTQFEQERTGAKPGFLSTLGSRISGLWKGDSGAKPDLTTAQGTGQLIHQQDAQQQQSQAADVARQQSGRSLPYRVAAAAGTGLGANVQAQEQSADIGDPGGVMGNTAADVAPLAAGELAGRVTGGLSKGRAAIGSAIRTRTGRVMSPSEIALSKTFPDPNVVDRAQAEAGSLNARMSAKADAAARQAQPVAGSAGPYRGPNQVAAQQRVASRADAAARQAQPVAGSAGPYRGPGSVPAPVQPPPAGATMTAPGAVSAAPTSTPGPVAPGEGPSSSGMPPGMPSQQAGLPLAQRIGQSAAPAPSRRIIVPGEEIDPMARENAGSAAQATEGDLRRLATAGDRSAAVELTRRRLPQGPTDYSRAPLPKGSLSERIPPPQSPSVSQRMVMPQSSQPQQAAPPVEQRVTAGKSPTGTERRAGMQDWQNAMSSTPPGQPTPGEKLASSIRQSSAAPANANEGLALRQIMGDPDMYARYKAADEPTQRAMMIAARNTVGGQQ